MTVDSPTLVERVPGRRRRVSGALGPRAVTRSVAFSVVALAGALLLLMPVIWIVSTSLKPDVEVYAIPPTVLPRHPTVEHFASVLGDETILRFFGNSLVASAGATACSLLMGIPAALGFARFRFRASGILLGAVLVTRMFPPVALALPFFLQFRQLGLINSPLGLIIAYIPIVLPLVIWMLEGFFRDLPEELLEAARLDGLGTIGALLRIVLPITKPGVAVAALFGFLVAWNEFIIALSLTRTPDAQTMPVGIAGYITQFQTLWGDMTAASVIYLVPVLVVTVVTQRGIISGLTAGATKG
jgi:multiple sugar transport system permease protein